MRVANDLYDGEHAHRRAKILDWHREAGVSLSSATFTDLFRLDPAGQARYVDVSSTRGTRWAVRAAASASAGEVRITTSGGATNTITVNSAVPAWYEGTITLPTDEHIEDGWIRDGLASRHSFNIDRRATSGNIVVYNVIVGEKPA